LEGERLPVRLGLERDSFWGELPAGSLRVCWQASAPLKKKRHQRGKVVRSQAQLAESELVTVREFGLSRRPILLVIQMATLIDCFPMAMG
jgi:hypothetical protein